MADNPITYAMKGRLAFSRTGWLLLEVPNDIGNGAFKSLSEHGIEQPISETHGRYNAHVSVMRPDEVEAIGGPDKIKARGQMIGFNLGPVREIANPGGWAEVSKVWVIEVRSPELMQLRKSLGLGEPKYPFHITFAIRKKHALVNKVASLIHFQEKIARSTEIKDSTIDGKGLFAARAFSGGEVIVSQFMRRTTGKDSQNVWDQSDDSRFTNHSSDPNCDLIKDGDTVQLVAIRDIAKGEELTGDYDRCGKVLGHDVEFTHRGKPYNGESSSARSYVASAHPTSDAVCALLSADVSTDHADQHADADDESTADGPGIHQTGEAADTADSRDGTADRRYEDSDVSKVAVFLVADGDRGRGRESIAADISSEVDVAGTDVRPDYRRKSALASYLCRSCGIDTGLPIKFASVSGGDYRYGYAGPDCAAIYETGTWRDMDLVKSAASGLLTAINKNQTDWGERLVKLRKRRGECPGCGTPFKEDEPYPNVEMCEVCERFGKPKLVKEGTDLAVQIATARKQTEEPKSQAQAEAGNYAKGKVKMHGMTIALENPKGSTRSGTDPNGKAWSVTMTADYGYILGTKGLDEDHIDVFIGPDPESEIVFVVDQLTPDGGKFDELKVMMGYTTEDAARDGYLAHYEDGWKGLGAITPLTMKQFHWWMDNCDQTKPVEGAKIKAAADSFYLNAIQQTPIQYNPQAGLADNLLNHMQRIRARGDRGIQEAASYDRLQNAMNPQRATQQFSAYLAGTRKPLVNHPLDRLLSEIA